MPSRRIVAVFDSRTEAEEARNELIGLGIKDDEIQVVDKSAQTFTTQNARGERGGFWARIREMFMPDEDRATIDECIRRGAFVLSASVSDQHADEAIRRLERAGAVDLDRRTNEWRAAGWDGNVATPTPPTAERPTSASTGESAALPVVEEHLRVGKREINRGTVRVRSYLVEEPVRQQVHLHDEHVEIERRAVDAPTRPVAQGSPGDLMKERTIEMTETAEQAVVSKEAVVKEEVSLKKTANERVEDVSDTVRHTEVDVEDSRGRAKPRSSKETPPQPTRR